MPFKVCCNIFNKSGHKIRDNLRPLTDKLIQRAQLLNLGVQSSGGYICDKCRIVLEQMPLPSTSSTASAIPIQEPYLEAQSTSTDSSPEKRNSPPIVDIRNENIKDLNRILGRLGEPPIESRHINSVQSYTKLNSVMSLLSEQIFEITPPTLHTQNVVEESKVWLETFKTSFEKQESKSMKIFMLTILPRKFWSNARIEDELGAPRRLVNEAMRLLENKGPYSFCEKKPPREYSPEIVSTVQDFYCTDEISRIMPGMRDKVMVHENYEKIFKSKRLVLWNLSDAYEIFCREFPEVKISFSKFAYLRPKECILAGTSGSHNVCVCMTHENVRLMCKPVGAILGLKSERDLLEKISCTKKSFLCAKNKCNDCQELEATFKQDAMNKLFQDSAREIYYNQWLMQDRYAIYTVTKSSVNFIEELLNQASNKLKLHDFIARSQAKFLKDRKTNLRVGEYILIMDYSENYSMVSQDEIQAAHFSKVQATIHPIVGYYRNASGDVDNFSFVIISNCLTHNTVAVHLYQKKCLEFIRSQRMLPTITHIEYFTDGSAAQYKNKKNFANLTHHLEDFGVPAEWHFFATSHGKGPSDGIGGTLKREARRSSLRGISISSANELYIWAQEWSSHDGRKMKFCFVEEDEVMQHEITLKERFINLKTVTGTQGYHHFSTDISNKNIVFAKTFSNATEYATHYLKK